LRSRINIRFFMSGLEEARQFAARVMVKIRTTKFDIRI